MRGLVPLLIAALVGACGGAPEGMVARRSAGIVGGIAAPGDEGIFLLETLRADGGVGRCSATLLAPRTLLTAAHCVTDADAGLRATNAQAPGLASPWSVVEAMQVHPGYEPTSGANDLALLWLTAPVSAAALPWNETDRLSDVEGKRMRAIGYGWSQPSGVSAPFRRSAALQVAAVSDEELELGDPPDRGICYGDSGGAALMMFPDGVERLVGALSRTLNVQCTQGAAVRVDRHRELISRWLSEREGIPACLDDGRCRAGCAPVDVDCACILDGVCRADCEAPERDVDCPTGCGADGVCVASGCGRKDEDCQPDGAACTSALRCEGGRCTSDAQHEETYCTRPCDASGGCPEGKHCDSDGVCRHALRPEAALGEPCTPDVTLCQSAVCVEAVDGARCRAPCDARARCEESADVCVSRSGQMVCELPSPVVTTKQPTSGCQVTPGNPLVLLALALWVGPLRGRCSRSRTRR